MEVKTKSKIYLLSITAVMTAVTCILGPMSIPIGPIPISLTNLCIFLSLYLLNWKLGTVSCVLYILIGMVGMPVFSGYSGGMVKLLGPTGGYILGFIPMAVIAGIVIDKFKSRPIQFIALIAATAVCYTFGTAWYCFQANCSFYAALGICVFPFIPVDLCKIFMVTIIGPMIRSRLEKAGLYRL